MKKITVNTLSLMALALLFTAIGNAQSFKVDVPFSFSVGQKTYPAGEYKVVAEAGNHVLTLYNADDRRSDFFSTGAMVSLTESNPNLKFVRQDGRVVLSEVWVAGGTGYKLSVPKPLAALARNSSADAEAR